MLEIVYAKNSEQFLWENSEQFYLMQKINFLNNVETKLILGRMPEIVYAENYEQFLWENTEQF